MISNVFSILFSAFDKISKSMIGHTFNLGKIQSQDTKNKISMIFFIFSYYYFFMKRFVEITPFSWLILRI